MGACRGGQTELKTLIFGRISPAAALWLEDPQPARALHIFERVCNLENSSGDIVSIQTPDVEMGPFSAALESFPWTDIRGGLIEVLDENSKITVEPGKLKLGALVILANKAEIWDPKLPPVEKLQPKVWLELANMIKKELVLHAPTGSLPWEIGPVLNAGKPIKPVQNISNSIVDRVANFAAELLAVIEAKDLENAVMPSRKLAGLGGGLTPAGDDFLLGVMYALWVLWPEEEARLWTEVLAKAAAPRTTPLSGVWLKAGAQPAAVESWLSLVRGWDDDDGARVRAALDHIVKTGHTSGADALAGFSSTITVLASVNTENISR